MPLALSITKLALSLEALILVEIKDRFKNALRKDIEVSLFQSLVWAIFVEFTTSDHNFNSHRKGSVLIYYYTRSKITSWNSVLHTILPERTCRTPVSPSHKAWRKGRKRNSNNKMFFYIKKINKFDLNNISSVSSVKTSIFATIPCTLYLQVLH